MHTEQYARASMRMKFVFCMFISVIFSFSLHDRCTGHDLLDCDILHP